MDLQTTVPLPTPKTKIDYTSELLLLGSCFAEHIGAKFDYYKFKTQINPFGILFHPKAIENFLWMATQGETYTETDLFFHNEQWHCFDAHSQLSHPDQNIVLKRLNNALQTTATTLKNATHVFITLGTAWVYRLQAMDLVVANCHKIPQKEFHKELVSIQEIYQCIENCTHLIYSLNPNAQITFSVSPVRHRKDGFVANTRSKSHLISAIHQFIENTETNVSYFPGYEVMMDELRDYRFYDTDMLHPNAIAIEYIWEQFVTSTIDESAWKTMQKVEEIQKGMAHRPHHPNSEQHLAFQQKLEHKQQELVNQYTYMVF